jgi:hypothetical protein
LDDHVDFRGHGGVRLLLHLAPFQRQASIMDMLSQLLRQAALQEKSPMEQFTQMFEDAKRNAAAEQSAPALPMKYVDPLFSSSFQKIQRDQFENRSKGTDSMYRQTYIGTATKFSSTSLYDLQPGRLSIYYDRIM